MLAAYQASSYEVVDGDARLVARIDREAPEIDALLERHCAASGTFITAWNPRSVPQPAATNRREHLRLADRIDAAGLCRLPHEGVSPDGDWREEGFFVLDLPEKEALAIAEAFGQNAVVRVQPSEPARLLLTGLMPSG